MTDFLDEKRDEIDDRLAELKPLIEEYNRLLAAAAALRGVDGSSVPGAVVSVPSSPVREVAGGESEESEESSDGAATPDVSSSDRDDVSSSSGGTADEDEREDDEGDGEQETAAASRPGGAPRRAGRPKGSGTRAAEALRIVREHPGVTIPELADRMGIKQNYLYRVLPELVQEGKIAKQGRGWHPRAA